MLLSTPAAFGEPGVAPCEKPPGDKVTCERNQLASCTVDKGTRAVEGRCQNPATPPKSPGFELWVLRQVIGPQVTPADLTRIDYQRALKEGRWEAGTKVTTFSLPVAP